jgi:hypothetical protein
MSALLLYCSTASCVLCAAGLSVSLFSIAKLRAVVFYCSKWFGGGGCIFRMVSKTLLGMIVWSSFRWLSMAASLCM